MLLQWQLGKIHALQVTQAALQLSPQKRAGKKTAAARVRETSRRVQGTPVLPLQRRLLKAA
jgi:hypothetical protein